MMEIGKKLCREEHEPADLVQNARRAEGAGYTFASKENSVRSCPRLRILNRLPR